MPPPTIIETERIVLREFDEDDLPTFFVLGNNPSIIRYTADPGGGFADLDDARAILHSRTLDDYRTVGYGRWACVDKASGAVIGFAGLKRLREEDEVDLGYRFLPEFWGRGLATESGRALVEYGFDELGLDCIVASVLPENTASVRVLDKLGFRFVDRYDEDGLEVLKYALERERAEDCSIQ